jgi:hypothetical protein
MAITDINISDTLETGAPSITYEGNEGPQDPRQEQQMMMAQLEEEYKKYVFEMQEQGLEPMSFQQFIEQVMAEGQMSSAQPMPNRQMAAYGGIMDLGGRRRYGLGSSLKKRIRKLIPNEAAKIATVAAPFVAPFNPALAGAMAGIGGFDQHGSLSRGLKSGLMTYGGGQLSRYLGGADFQQNPFTQGGAFRGGLEGFRGGFSSPIGSGGIKELFKGKTPVDPTEGTDLGLHSKRVASGDLKPSLIHEGGDAWVAEAEALKDAGAKTIVRSKDVIPKTGTGSVLESIKQFGLDNKATLGILGLSAAAGAYTAATEVDEVVEEMDRGVPLKIREIREEVIEAFKDPTGKKLEAIRIKYPFLGAKETKNIDIMAQGGRAGLYSGGLSIPSENTMEDARKTAMQDRLGGITEIMKQADLYRQGDVGQMYMAGGGDTTPWWKFWADEKAAAEELTPQQKNKIKKQKRLEELKKELDMAQGGRIGAQEGGLMDLGGMEKDYRQEGGFVPIGGQEKADDVPARLSKNEFVFTADAVRGAGDGDIDKGAEIMENVMKNLENGGRISEESQGLKGAREMFEVSERLSEVI